MTPSPWQVVLVEPVAETRQGWADHLRARGYEITPVADADALAALLSGPAPDVVVAPLGIVAARSEVGVAPGPAWIVVADAAERTAVLAARRHGVEDHVVRPVAPEHLEASLAKVCARLALRRDALTLRGELESPLGLDDLVAGCPAMYTARELAVRAAPTRAAVLITGEPGTGKETLAMALHARSPRAARPFVKLCCAGLAEDLLERALFGSEPDLDAGAPAGVDGALTRADGGTLFLAEIGDMPCRVQFKLARFLQERHFERIGGGPPRAADVRVIAATSRHLEGEVARGAFREDLFYRLDAVDIALPPLRERDDDIRELARRTVAREAVASGRPRRALSPDALAALVDYTWPGNVTELVTTLRLAVATARGPLIERADLPLVRPPPVRVSATLPPVPGSTIAELERFAILETVAATRGSTSRAADILGVSTRTVQYRLHAYHLPDAAPTPDVPGLRRRRG